MRAVTSTSELPAVELTKSETGILYRASVLRKMIKAAVGKERAKKVIREFVKVYQDELGREITDEAIRCGLSPEQAGPGQGEEKAASGAAFSPPGEEIPGKAAEPLPNEPVAAKDDPQAPQRPKTGRRQGSDSGASGEPRTAA